MRGGGTRAYATDVDGLAIGSYQFFHANTNMMLSTEGAFADRFDAGNIGLGVLKNFVVTFDLSNRMVYLKPGANFIVLAVDNTRLADGVPTLKTDWWNYGGLHRDVSLVEVPQQFIDDYDLHLSRKDHATIEGWVHVEGAPAGSSAGWGVNVSPLRSS